MVHCKLSLIWLQCIAKSTSVIAVLCCVNFMVFSCIVVNVSIAACLKMQENNRMII